MLPGVLSCISRPSNFFTNLTILHGGTFEFKGPWFSSFDFIITSNPMNINHILSRKFDNYGKGSEYRELFFDAMGDGIFNADSNSWKIQRKMLMSLLHSSKFIRRVEKIIKQKLEKGLIPMLENLTKLDAEVDLQDVIERFNYDCSCLLVLGFDPNSLSIEFPEVPTKEAFFQVEEVLLYRHIVPTSFWKLQKWLQIGVEKKMSKALETINNFMYQCISLKRQKLIAKSLQVEEDDEIDLLTAFMVEKEEEVSVIGKSDKVLRDIVINVLAAGKDTLTSSLSWFFWLVATNPSIESKILEEIKANSPKGKDHKMMFIKGEELNRFIYLHAALCETLRLYPAVPSDHKTASESDILPSGHQIDKKSRILLNFKAMGMMKEIWGEDCVEFKPERWISKQGDIVQVPSYKFTAFGAGPRSCLGKDLSFIHMKIIAIAILWNYQVEVVKGHSPIERNSILFLMKNGLKVKIKKRVA
ncbi:hypothetical protein REPUB_Repub09cG0021300 [Reevesia pubescens]